MKLEFGKYTDVTNLAKKIAPALYEEYIKVYICPDTNNWWVSMVQKDINSEYEECPGMFLIERNNPDYMTGGKLPQIVLDEPERFVKAVLKDWDGCCWDNTEAYSMEQVEGIIADIFGIIPEED